MASSSAANGYSATTGSNFSSQSSSIPGFMLVGAAKLKLGTCIASLFPRQVPPEPFCDDVLHARAPALVPRPTLPLMKGP